MVGGTTPLAITRLHTAASIAPAAPSRWPVIDLVEASITFCAYSPKTRLTAVVSVRSFGGVEVPWALMYWMSEGDRPASRSARSMLRAAPSPPGVGDVM